MRAATHAFAVSVEDQGGDIGQPVCLHRLAEAALQAFDCEAGRNLADKPAGIGKAGLDRDPSAQARILLVAFLCQQRVEEPPTMFEGAFGFEQGRNIDLVLDPEQLGEIERCKDRRGLFAFGDQHADRRVGVDMGEDLRHCEELADRGRAFDRKGREVGSQRLYRREHFAQRCNRALAGEVQRIVRVDPAADRIMQLAGIYAEVDPPHSQTVCAHGRGECLEGDGAILVGIARLVFQRVDQRRERQQLVRIVRRQPVGSRRKRFRFGQVACEIRRACLRVSERRAQGAEQRVIGIDPLKRCDVAGKSLGFLTEAETDRIIPFDIGPAVHVVTDPAGETERQWRKVLPLVRPFGRRMIE